MQSKKEKDVISLLKKSVFYDCWLSFNPYQLKHAYLPSLELLLALNRVPRREKYAVSKHQICDGHWGIYSIEEPDKVKGVVLECFLEFVANNMKATLQKICYLVTGPKVLKSQE